LEKVVVTGAAGFIGSHICEALLSRGFAVVGIDSFNPNYDAAIKKGNIATSLADKNFSFVEESLNDLNLGEVLEGARFVFHLAAQPGVRQSWQEQFDDYIDANIRATHRLCNALVGKPIKKLVYASSSSVYGETTQLPMNESHPTRPLSPYGVTKLSGEALCLLYQQNYGVPAVALRFFTVYGPRQRPDMAVNKFIQRGLDGQPIRVYGNGTQTRDFTYVSDIVDANLRAMEYTGTETVFNIGGGTRVTLNVALDILSGALPQPLDVAYEDPVKGDVTHTYADIGLANKELGYSPTVGLEEGIAKEVEWIRSTRSKEVGRGRP